MRARDPRSGEEFGYSCLFIINAAVVWAANICRMAGANIDINFSKGSLLVLNQSLTNRLINRCRPPGSGDIFVPNGPALIIGTTSQTTQEIENTFVEGPEVDLPLYEGKKLIPGIGSSRAIRAYAGIRPLMGACEGPEDARKITRDFLLIDHAEHDGIKGLISIIGGKLTTYRLMAEKTADLICRHLNNKASCVTHYFPLPFSKNYNFQEPASKLRRISKWHSLKAAGQIVCECELVFKDDVSQQL